MFISWKWSFSDPSRNRVSLVLQHNLEDEDEKIGNAVKLTLHNRLEEDAAVSRQQKPDRPRSCGSGGSRRRRGSPRGIGSSRN